MSAASDLIARGQAFQAAQFPAVITIGAQSYTVGSSGEKREQDLMTGGWLKKKSITFWIKRSAFADAGQPVAAERDTVICAGITYRIDNTSNDAGGLTMILHCKTPEE